jgi:hypothetical protein
MIVSALVVTSRSSMTGLVDELGLDERFQVGSPERGFLPLVVTTEDVRSSRELFEQLRRRPGVDDLQLVSWADEDAIHDQETCEQFALSEKMP